MSTVEEVARLIVQAEAQGFDDTRRKIAAAEGSLQALTDGYKTGGVSVDDYRTQGARLQSQIDDEKAALQAAEEALKTHGTTQKALAALTEQSRSKMAGFGQSMLQVGRVTQDFQAAGLRGILNNFEGLALALGMGSGVAGALTVAGVAFETFKPQIKAFWESLHPEGVQVFTDAIVKLQDRIKELQDQPTRLAIDLREIDEAERRLKVLQRARAAFESLGDRQAKAEAESGRAIDQAITESGRSEEIQAQLRSGMVRERSRTDPGLRDAEAAQAQAQEDINTYRNVPGQAAVQARARAEARLAEAQERARVARARIAQGAEDAIGEVLSQSTKGHGAAQAQAQRQLADLLGGIGERDLAHDVRANSPANTRKYMQAQEDFKETQEQAKERAEEARKAAAETKKRDLAAIDRENAAEASSLREVEAHFKDQHQADARAKTQADAARRAENAALETQVAAQRQAIAARAKALGQGPIGAQAEALGAQALASGATRDRALDAIAGQVGAFLRRSQPGMDPHQAFSVANRVAADALERVQETYQEQMARTLDQTAAVQATVALTQQAVAKFANRLGQIAAGTNQLGRQAEQLIRHADEMQPSALNFGS